MAAPALEYPESGRAGVKPVIPSDVIDSLKTCELFDTPADREMRVLMGSLGTGCTTEAYRGEHVFGQSQLSSRLYVIASGQVLLQRSVSVGRKEAAVWPLGLLGAGRAMGWSALLYGPRHAAASAVCQKPGKIAAIGGDSARCWGSTRTSVSR